jgi:hypothetical protein
MRPEHHQREVLGRAEQQRQRGQRRAERRDQHGREAARDERPDRRDRERRTRTPLSGHLMAVERSDHRGRLARYVDEDRGSRSTILRAVIDAGEHDQCADWREAECDRQQHRNGGERTNAGEHADQRADQDTDQAQSEIDGRNRDGEAVYEICNEIHLPGLPRTAARAGAED